MDLLVVSEGVEDDAFAMQVIRSVSCGLKANMPTVVDLVENARGFTHVLVVSSEYHGYLRGVEGLDRSNLNLCIPIYRCEFSGNESIEEFKLLNFDRVPTLHWQRGRFPRLRVYFDNPRTGAGTTESGAFFKMSDLLREIEEMNGVSEGFLEITNWRRQVLEVLSPSHDEYILITGGVDEESVSKDAVHERLKAFSGC